MMKTSTKKSAIKPVTRRFRNAVKRGSIELGLWRVASGPDLALAIFGTNSLRAGSTRLYAPWLGAQ